MGHPPRSDETKMTHPTRRDETKMTHPLNAMSVGTSTVDFPFLDPCPNCPTGTVCKRTGCGRLVRAYTCPPPSTADAPGYSISFRPVHETPPVAVPIPDRTFWVAESSSPNGSLYSAIPDLAAPETVDETGDIQKAVRFADRESCERFIGWQYRDVPTAMHPAARQHGWT